jgi:TolA-binding protein
MTAYVEGRYEDAIGFLQNAGQRDKKTDDVNFYLGVSQILAGHPQEASAPLGKVIALENSAYLQSAHYYLGKAYVQQMKLDQAESEFGAAAVLPGRVTADSKALLARIAALRAQLEAK